MTSSRHLEGVRAFGRAADAFETVAWRAPPAARFDNRVANEEAARETTLKDVMAAMPDWLVIVGGGVIAGLMGAMLGGALQI